MSKHVLIERLPPGQSLVLDTDEPKGSDDAPALNWVPAMGRHIRRIDGQWQGSDDGVNWHPITLPYRGIGPTKRMTFPPTQPPPGSRAWKDHYEKLVGQHQKKAEPMAPIYKECSADTVVAAKPIDSSTYWCDDRVGRSIPITHMDTNTLIRVAANLWERIVRHKCGLSDSLDNIDSLRAQQANMLDEIERRMQYVEFLGDNHEA